MKRIYLAIFITLIAIGRNSQAQELKDIKIAILTADSTHDAELFLPYAYFKNQGAEVTIISNYMGEMNCYNSDITYNAEKLIGDVNVKDFDLLAIPGGHSPAKLRKSNEVNQFVKEFAESGKLVAAICHGPQVLVSNGLLDGKQATCVGLMKHEFEAAGVEFVNKNVVITDNIITGKNPRSIAEWCVAIKNEIVQQN